MEKITRLKGLERDRVKSEMASLRAQLAGEVKKRREKKYRPGEKPLPSIQERDLESKIAVLEEKITTGLGV